MVRALKGLGDMLCAVPALRALRRARSAAHVALLGVEAARPVVDRFPHYIDELITLPAYPGIPECAGDVRALPEFFRAMHRRRFDLALQMHGSGTVSNPLTPCTPIWRASPSVGNTIAILAFAWWRAYRST